MYKTEDELNELYQQYIDGTIKLSRKEKLKVNPKVAYEVVNEDIVKSIPFKEVEKLKAAYGSINRFSKITPVENLRWDFFHFVDSDVFRPAALVFEKSFRNCMGTIQKPTYTSHLKGTPKYEEFWKEEYDRCTKGYEPIVDGVPCGIRIPGEFYFYLNYCWINQIILDKETGMPIKNESSFPKFLAMDYYYFKELESREDPERYGLPITHKKSMIVAKARRLGFSYKGASGAAWKIIFNKDKKVVIASAEGSDAATCFKKAISTIDHLSQYTEFGLEKLGASKSNGGWVHAKRSVKETEGKIELNIINTRTGQREGRNSSIVTASLYNKKDAIAGEGLSRLYFEEAGKTSNLEPAWNFARPAMMQGKFYRGIAIIFGTGGEMVASAGKDGYSKGFSNLFYSPEANSLAEYDNIYDYIGSGKKCGYFVPAMWYMPDVPIVIGGKKYWSLDSQGNACFWVAELVINKERINKLPPLTSKESYDEYLTQICKTPSEAFMVTHTAIFQTDDLMARQNEIQIELGGFNRMRMPGELIEDSNGQIKFLPKPELTPVTMQNIGDSNYEGCLLQYEPPLYINDKVPDDVYIISCDAIRNNDKQGKSRVAVIVYKYSKDYPELGNQKIVATYYGRRKENPLNYMHRLLVKLCKYYNAKLTFENNADGGILNYFTRYKLLHYLLPEPTTLLNKIMPTRTKSTNMKYGHPMTTSRHKEEGVKYVYEWLDERDGTSIHYDDYEGNQMNKEGSRNLDRLNDELLIEQLINYSYEGNFDSVSAMMGIVYRLKEIEEMADIKNSKKGLSEQISNLYKNVYGYGKDNFSKYE